MRQLLAEGWMHNRVRMGVASFLIKDLHLPWQRGARHFLDHLVDGDVASNNHGWQWVAGSGPQAAPFFRIFNPVSQGEKFDPDGDYVRPFVPSCAAIARQGGAPAVGPGRRHPDGLPGADRRPRHRTGRGVAALGGPPALTRSTGRIDQQESTGHGFCRRLSRPRVVRHQRHPSEPRGRSAAPSAIRAAVNVVRTQAS